MNVNGNLLLVEPEPSKPTLEQAIQYLQHELAKCSIKKESLERQLAELLEQQAIQ